MFRYTSGLLIQYNLSHTNYKKFTEYLGKVKKAKSDATFFICFDNVAVFRSQFACLQKPGPDLWPARSRPESSGEKRMPSGEDIRVFTSSLLLIFAVLPDWPMIRQKPALCPYLQADPLVHL